tara:strand:- start:414 stop:1283 length:870 start_codon:yes stop_codon:yes gene_type:complete
MKKINNSTRIIIIGGHEQAVLCLEYLIKKKYNLVLCICRSDDNGKDNFFPSLAKKAKKFKIPFLKTKNINSHIFFKKVESFSPDLVLSLQNNYILNENWINYFKTRKGIVNIHFSLLPKYSGYWPEMWAIWNEEKFHGVTLHYISNVVDEGNIIIQKKFKINKLENRFSLYLKCTFEGFKLLKKTIPRITKNKIRGKVQNLVKKSYYFKKMPNDGILDLNWKQKKIERFLRSICFPGFPGVKIKIGNQDFNIIYGELPDHKQINIFSNEKRVFPENYIINNYLTKKSTK